MTVKKIQSIEIEQSEQKRDSYVFDLFCYSENEDEKPRKLKIEIPLIWEDGEWELRPETEEQKEVAKLIEDCWRNQAAAANERAMDESHSF